MDSISVFFIGFGVGCLTGVVVRFWLSHWQTNRRSGAIWHTTQDSIARH